MKPVLLASLFFALFFIAIAGVLPHLVQAQECVDEYQPSIDKVWEQETQTAIRDLIVDLDKMYGVDTEGYLSIWALSADGAPELLNQIFVTESAGHLFFCGSNIFVKDYDNDLHFIDVTDAADPVVYLDLIPGQEIHSIQIVSDNLYAACGETGIRVYNIQNPMAPLLVGDFCNTDFLDGRGLYSLSINEDKLYSIVRPVLVSDSPPPSLLSFNLTHENNEVLINLDIEQPLVLVEAYIRINEVQATENFVFLRYFCRGFEDGLGMGWRYQRFNLQTLEKLDNAPWPTGVVEIDGQDFTFTNQAYHLAVYEGATPDVGRNANVYFTEQSDVYQCYSATGSGNLIYASLALRDNQGSAVSSSLVAYSAANILNTPELDVWSVPEVLTYDRTSSNYVFRAYGRFADFVQVYSWQLSTLEIGVDGAIIPLPNLFILDRHPYLVTDNYICISAPEREIRQILSTQTHEVLLDDYRPSWLSSLQSFTTNDRVYSITTEQALVYDLENIPFEVISEINPPEGHIFKRICGRDNLVYAISMSGSSYKLLTFNITNLDRPVIASAISIPPITNYSQMTFNADELSISVSGDSDIFVSLNDPIAPVVLEGSTYPGKVFDDIAYQVDNATVHAYRINTRDNHTYLGCYLAPYPVDDVHEINGYILVSHQRGEVSLSQLCANSVSTGVEYFRVASQTSERTVVEWSFATYAAANNIKLMATSSTSEFEVPFTQEQNGRWWAEINSAQLSDGQPLTLRLMEKEDNWWVAVQELLLAGSNPGKVASIRGISPNPFNPKTSIAFYIDKATTGQLAVYDLAGRRVNQLASGHMAAGEHNIEWNGTDDGGRALPSGQYFVRLSTERHVETQKMTLLR